MRSLTHGTERWGRTALRVTALLTLATVFSAAPNIARAQAPGGFAQLSSPFGCIANGGDGITCSTAHDISMGFLARTVISPDGHQLYAIAYASNTLLVFDRNEQTGALTQKGGTEGCLVNGAATATCKAVTRMSGPVDLEISPDGNTVWAASFFSGVATFTRHPDGTLDQKSGLDACIADSDAGCRDARALSIPFALTIGPGGDQLYVATAGTGSVVALDVASDGVLTQLADSGGFFGCVSDVVSAPDNCQDGRSMSDLTALDITPDGSNLYTGGFADHSVVALERSSSGQIRMVTGANQCVDGEGADGCVLLSGLSSVRDIEVTNGNQVNVANEGGDTVYTLDRMANGGVTRRADPSGCISETAQALCTDDRGLDQPFGLGASPDGRHLYVASAASNSVVEERIAPGGGLSPRTDARGCVSLAAASSSCSQGVSLAGAADAEVSADGRFIYVPARDANSIVVLKRDAVPPECQDASATVAPGAVVTLTLPCGDSDGDALTRTVLTPPALGNLGPVNQNTGQVTFASSGVPGTASFTFRASSNGFDGAPRTFTITVPAPPTLPLPTVVTLIPSTVGNNWAAARTFTTVISLSAKRLPAGAKVVVKCKTKSKRLQKKRCPYKSKSFKAPAGKAQVNLAKQFRKKKLPVGTKITITITAPTFIGKVFTYTTRRRAIPRLKLQCLAPGATKAGSCPG